MKRTAAGILLALFLCITSAQAQNFRGGYFLEDYPYAYKLNPAFGYDRDFIGPLFGQSVSSVKSPLSIKDFLFPSADGKKLVTGLHPSVSADKFLPAFKRKQNSVILEEDYTIFAYGFKYGRSYHVLDVSLRSGLAMNAPYDFFEFMKEGTERRKEFDFSDLFVKTHTWLELSYGRTFEINDRLTLGARQKILAGLSYGSVHAREMQVTLNSDYWRIQSKSDMEFAGKAIKYELTKSGSGKEINQVDLSSFGIRPVGFLGLNGLGISFDAGINWQATPHLSLSAAMLDLGGIKWFDSMYARTKSVDYVRDPNHTLDDGEGNPASSMGAMLKFRPQGKKKNSFDPMTVTFNAGIKCILPFYDRISVGLLGVYKVDNIFNWWELRPSINAAPLNWLSLSLSAGYGRYGMSYGAVASFRTKYLQFFAGTDAYVREMSPQLIPLTKLNHNFVAGIAVPLESRGRDNLLFRLWRWSIRPNPILEEDWIIQPDKGLSVSSGYELHRTGSDFTSNMLVLGDDLYGMANTQIKLEDRAAHTVSAGIGYGPFSLSISQEVGRGKENSSSLSFSYITSYYGIDFRYRKYSSRADVAMSLVLDTLGRIPTVNAKSYEPADMYNLIVDGFYAFNRRHFSYAAVYNAKNIQRRTAGSWLLAAQYMQGSLIIDNKDYLLMDLTRGFGQYGVRQYSLGGGYSCNWVPYHRDPLSRSSLKGLRNIALNITAMPVFAIVNKSTISRYLKTGDYEYSGKIDKDYALLGYFQPNILLKAGACVSLGRFVGNLWTDFNSFRCKGGHRSFKEKNGYTYHLDQEGSFSSFRLCFGLRYGF